jgi:hypothetical protein
VKRGQLPVFKGQKSRAILLSASTWKELSLFYKPDEPDAPLFKSLKGGHLATSHIGRIVRAAANKSRSIGKLNWPPPTS